MFHQRRLDTDLHKHLPTLIATKLAENQLKLEASPEALDVFVQVVEAFRSIQHLSVTEAWESRFNGYEPTADEEEPTELNLATDRKSDTVLILSGDWQTLSGIFKQHGVTIATAEEGKPSASKKQRITPVVKV